MVGGDVDLNSLVWNCELWIWKFNRMKCNSKARMWWMQIVHYKLHCMPFTRKKPEKNQKKKWNCIKFTEAELFCCSNSAEFVVLSVRLFFLILSSFFCCCMCQFDHNEIVCKMHAVWMWMIHDLNYNWWTFTVSIVSILIF